MLQENTLNTGLDAVQTVEYRAGSGVATQTWDPDTWSAEARGSCRVPGQPGLWSKILSQQKQKFKTNRHVLCLFRRGLHTLASPDCMNLSPSKMDLCCFYCFLKQVKTCDHQKCFRNLNPHNAHTTLKRIFITLHSCIGQMGVPWSICGHQRTRVGSFSSPDEPGD